MSTQHEEEIPVRRINAQAPQGSFSGATFERIGDGTILKRHKNIIHSAKMQAEFKTTYFLIPKVISYSQNEMVMQEVKNATNAAVYLSKLDNKTIDKEVETYINFINNNITGVNYVSRAPFIRKLLEIINRLSSVGDIRLCERLAVALEAEYKMFIGAYHGDFTLCNILYPGRYLIDFTPAYVASPSMDIVKLKQETTIGWSKIVNKIDRGNYERICLSIERCLGYHFKEDTRHLEAMNLLRILPYSRSAELTKVLHKKINELL